MAFPVTSAGGRLVVTEPRALLFVTNGISATMGRAALERDGHDLSETVLVRQRRVALDWADACAETIDFTGKPALNMVGQVNQIGFTWTLVRRMRALLKAGSLRDIYIPNIDNLMTSHILSLVERGDIAGAPRLSVITEGLMNYQEIGIADRAGWRWRIKPILAGLLGLRYRQPSSHLSGAFEPAVTRVIAYSDAGLKAPPEKVSVIPYPRVEPRVAPDPAAALLIITGIGQWMEPEQFARFRDSFAEWMNRQGFDRIFYKPHPHYDGGGIERLIANAVPLGDSRSLEAIAAEIPAQTVIGYCTTGLVTLKMQRPDLRLIDWGSDFYCEHAYHGDRSVVDVLRNAGVEIVEMDVDRHRAVAGAHNLTPSHALPTIDR